MRMTLAGLLLFFLGSVNAATDTMTLNVNAQQPSFQVTLPANPTTGFKWTVTNYDQSLLQLTSSNYIAPQSKLIGAGGQMQFTFALAPGKTYPASTIIQFKYARPWESKKGSLKKVIVNFQNKND